MGLDTVELIYTIERHFSIDVPDPVCEKLYTVGDVANYFSQRLGVVGVRQSAMREAVVQQLSGLLELPPDAFAENNMTMVGQLLPDTAAVARFQRLISNCGLEPPKLSGKVRPEVVQPSMLEKLLGITPVPTPTPWYARPLSALADWTVATNYQQLPMPPASEYEVERIIMGITSDKSGVPVAEILLTSSFVYDLRMD
jgi:hypothetical protein